MRPGAAAESQVGDGLSRPCGHLALGQVPWLSHAPPRALPVGNKKPRAPGCRAVGGCTGSSGVLPDPGPSRARVGSGGAEGLRREELEPPRGGAPRFP